jgi:drug/metabolite transporter (DMT)-like permease
MDNWTKRFLLFFIGCIGVRVFFVYLAKNVNIQYLPYLGYLALLPAFGMYYIFFTGSRKTGAEVFGENIWWNSLRPLHATLYALFAYNAIMKNPNAWIYLLIDVSIGFTATLAKRL